MISWYDLFEPKVATWEVQQDMARLIAGLSDTDLEVRCLSYDALGRLGLADTRVSVCKAILTEDFASVRARGAIALGRLGGPDATVILYNLLNDDDWEVRTAATRSLGRQKNLEFLTTFCMLLEDDHDSVIIEAIYALAQLSNYRAITALHRLFDRPDRSLRDLAASAINAINLNQSMGLPADEVYFFTYTLRQQLLCECYSYKLVTWRNYLRRRWQTPWARNWGIGYWEISTLAERLKSEMLKPGFKLAISDRRA